MVKYTIENIMCKENAMKKITKKLFLKRILPIALCLLMVLPAFAMNIFAANMSLTGIPGDKSIIGTERQNWAPNGQGYHTSAWNYDRHSKYLNNGTYAHSYQYWQPSDPQRPNGNGVDPTQQHVGFTFSDGYYLIDEVVIYANSYDRGYNNIKYTVMALILGEWVEVGVGYQDDGVQSEHGGDVTKLSIKLKHPDAASGADINTNNIRIWCSEYGSYAKRYGEYENKQPTSHDWWLTPCMQEVELWGYTGYRPEFDVPMGAELTTNAALSGMIGADSSMSMKYPGLAADDDRSTGWKAMTKGAQNIWADFDKAYKIDNVGVNFGGCESVDVGMTVTYNIKVKLPDGTWQYVVTGATATTTSANEDTIVHTLDQPIEALGFMVEFTDLVGGQGRAVVTELLAQISEGGKCIFLADYITNAKKVSTATGNLACYGAAYASSNFSYAGISQIAYIIDGNISYDDDAWIAETYVRGTYVGVTLREAHDVSKVVLYFGDRLGGTDGQYVFKFELQAKVNGEYVTIATATSYDAVKKSYTVSIELKEAVYTDDLRIVYISDAQTFPYLKEFEIFESGFMYSSFSGYSLDTSRTYGGPAATTEFGARTTAKRGKYFDKQSPISYFNLALEHEIEVDWFR